MPNHPLSPCRVRGCPGRAIRNGRCRTHAAMAERIYDQRRGTATQRGYDRQWRNIRDKQLSDYLYCSVCGAIASEVDHIVPKSVGGTDDPLNLDSKCKRCHSAKTAKEGGFGRR